MSRPRARRQAYVTTSPRHDGERLRLLLVNDHYQAIVAPARWVTPLLDEVQRTDAGKTAEARRHLDKASLSVLPERIQPGKETLELFSMLTKLVERFD